MVILKNLGYECLNVMKINVNCNAPTDVVMMGKGP